MKIGLPFLCMFSLLSGCVSQPAGLNFTTSQDPSLSALGSSQTTITSPLSIGFSNGEFMTLENSQNSVSYTDKKGIERLCALTVFNGQKFQYVKADGFTLRVTTNGTTFNLTRQTNFSGTRSIDGTYTRQFPENGVLNLETVTISNNVLTVVLDCDI